MPIWQSLPLSACQPDANTSLFPANQGQGVYLRPKSASIRVCQSLSWNKAPGSGVRTVMDTRSNEHHMPRGWNSLFIIIIIQKINILFVKKLYLRC